MKRYKEEYQEWHERCPIWGFPTEEEQCYSAKMVLTRSLKCCAACQECSAPDSAKDSYERFPKGQLMLKETCVYSGEGWRSSYTCTYCLDEWIDELPKR